MSAERNTGLRISKTVVLDQFPNIGYDVAVQCSTFDADDKGNLLCESVAVSTGKQCKKLRVGYSRFCEIHSAAAAGVESFDSA